MAGTVYGSRIVADVTLRSLSPYSQSRAHDEPAYENESKAAYDRGRGDQTCTSKTAPSAFLPKPCTIA